MRPILTDVLRQRIFALARVTGSFAFGEMPIGWSIWFGVGWLASFTLTWHVLWPFLPTAAKP
jgi:hypothetical protein